MAELIKKTDTLNQGREKLNTAITDAETAKNISAQADDKATQALTQSESTQTQLDTIVINGDSSVEAAQARVSTTGTAYGTLKQRLDSEYQEVTTQLAQTVTYPNTKNAVGEWWIHPLSTYLEYPYPRTVNGAIASNGDILATEYNHGTGKDKRYVVGKAVIDDHNVPALWMDKGHRPVIAWTNHNNDHFLRFKVGSINGDLGSLTVAKEVAINTGNRTSYTQIHRITHLSDETQDTFYMLFRFNNQSWRIFVFSVNQITGQLTTLNPSGIPFISSPNRQCYVISADAFSEGNQVIRFAWGYNPALSVHSIRYIELDVVTGQITSPFDIALNANIDGTNLPIVDDTVTPMIEETPANMSRRLFYVRSGIDKPAVAYADWTIGDEDNAIYKVTELDEPVKGGLKVNQGYASTPGSVEMNKADGFEVKVIAKFDVTPSATAELARRYESSSNGSFFFRIKTDRTFSISIVSTSGVRGLDLTQAIPGGWRDIIGYGFKFVRSENKVYPMYSLDEGETWVTMEGESFPAIFTVDTTNTAPFVVPTSSHENYKAPSIVYSATLKSLDGTLIAGFEDIETQWNTDPTGKVWSLTGDAVIEETSQDLITNEFGVSGTRVGYSANANYIAGMCFEYPSYDRSVITAHTDGTKETVKKWRYDGVNYVPETLLEMDTKEGRLIRPYAPVNNGAVPVVLTKMKSYSGYTDYQGDLVTT